MPHSKKLQIGDIVAIKGISSSSTNVAIITSVSHYGFTAESLLFRAFGNNIPFNGGTFGNLIDPTVMLKEGKKVHLAFNTPGKKIQKMEIPLKLNPGEQYPALTKADFDAIRKIEDDRNLVVL